MNWSHEEVYNEWMKKVNGNSVLSDSIASLTKFVENTLVNEPKLEDIASDHEIDLAVNYDILNTFVTYRLFALRCWVEDEVKFLRALLDTYNNPKNNIAVILDEYSEEHKNPFDESEGYYAFSIGTTKNALHYQQRFYEAPFMNAWLSSDEIELIRPDAMKLFKLMEGLDEGTYFSSIISKFSNERYYDKWNNIIDHSMEYEGGTGAITDGTMIMRTVVIHNDRTFVEDDYNGYTEAVFGARRYLPDESDCMSVYMNYLLDVAKYNNSAINNENYSDDEVHELIESNENKYLYLASEAYFNQLDKDWDQ